MPAVQVVPYDGDWLESFRDEAHKLRAIFAEEILAIHHIGSTSITGMSAKPTIDMLPVVRDIAAVDGFNSRMREAGYIPRGEYGLPSRRFFIRDTRGKRTHNIHIYGQGHADIERHLAFRDYLYAFPDIADEYKTLKLALAEKFSNDLDAYCRGKDPFIKRVEQDALRWKRGA